MPDSTNTENGSTARDRDPVAGQILYGVEQAARILGISPKLVRCYIDRGELRARRCGMRVLVHRRELEKFGNRDHEGIG